MTTKTYLTCPQCASNLFNQVTVGHFNLDDIDFINPLKPTDSQIAYVCAQCGFPVDRNTIHATKRLVVITGNSSGYKRRAMAALGLEEQEWSEFLNVGTIILVEKRAWKNKSELLEQALTGSIIEMVDVSDGNMEGLTELKLNCA